MLQPGPIASYLDALAREVAFDTSLSRRIRAEVEDHLWEAADHRPGGASEENQQSAIAQFGDARELARQLVPAYLLAQMRRVALSTLVAVVAMFVLMKARIAWYGYFEWKFNQDWPGAMHAGLWIYQCAFAAALILALIGCIHIGACRVPVRFDAGYGRRLHDCIVLCVMGALALMAMVATEVSLTCLRLRGIDLPIDAAFPMGALMGEIAAIVWLAALIRGALRSKAAALVLLG